MLAFIYTAEATIPKHTVRTWQHLVVANVLKVVVVLYSSHSLLFCLAASLAIKWSAHSYECHSGTTQSWLEPVQSGVARALLR